MFKSIAAVSLVVAAAMAVSSAVPAVAAPAFNGIWYVAILTKAGDCKGNHRHPILIENGILRNASEKGRRSRP